MSEDKIWGENMLEKSVEEYLIQGIKYRGGECIKIETSSERGWPDRLCILPYGIIFLVETKKPKGGVISKYQGHVIGRINDLGTHAYIAHTREVVDSILKEVDKMIHHYEEGVVGDI
ncbi:MAG: VRR-NUC domain-containing protein [Anaeroplasma sp.]